MRMEKEKSYPGFQVGTSFLLVIFVLLCMVLLGVLSLAGALRDKGYSDKIAEKTKAYYSAVSEAQHKLGEIDKAVAGAGGNYEKFETYLDDAAAAAASLDLDACERSGEKLVLSYKVPVTDSQSLFVEVEVLDPQKREGNIKIIKWQESSENVWEEQGTLPVLQWSEE